MQSYFFARFKFFLISIPFLTGCAAIEGAPKIIDKNGPLALQHPPRSAPTAGLVYNFNQSYLKAAAEEAAISMGSATAPTASTDPVSQHARQMAIDGINLIDGNCDDFFNDRGEDETLLNISRDTTAASGSLASGVLSLASPANAVASAVLSLLTTTTASGFDIYTKNFLFGSNNIDSVRTMTLAALATHKAAALPGNDTTVWHFGDASEVIMDHQNYCTPSKIRSLVLDSISSGKFQAVSPNSPATTNTVANATAAAGAAAPTVPGVGTAAIAAVGAASNSAQSAAAASKSSGDTENVMAQKATAAAMAAVTAAVQTKLPDAPAADQQNIVGAIAGAIGEDAAQAAQNGTIAPNRHIVVEVTQ